MTEHNYTLATSLRDANTKDELDNLVKLNNVTYRKLSTQAVNKHCRIEFTHEEGSFESFIHNKLLADEYLSGADRLARKY